MAGQYIGVINIDEREANIINLMGYDIIEIYQIKYELEGKMHCIAVA